MTRKILLAPAASLILFMIAVLLLVSALAGAGDVEPKPLISFRLDPGLTRGMYMGERWVSPPKFSAAGKGQELTIAARSALMGAGGRLAAIRAEWSAGDAGRIFLSSLHEEEVAIRVLCDTDSTVSAAYHGRITVLRVRSRCRDGAITVEISR